ncbi:MAG: hypothetical protein WCR52_22305 [Bacteroidota bacterium]|uniref:hypothetical protein n=1 Tax=Runella sp. TaxID=1960881 RepID=UPI003017BD96
MPIRTILDASLHAICCGTIVYFAFSILESQPIQFDTPLRQDMAQQGLPAVERLQQCAKLRLQQIEKSVIDFPEYKQQFFLERARQIYVHTDSLLKLPMSASTLSDFSNFLKPETSEEQWLFDDVTRIATMDTAGVFFHSQNKKWANQAQILQQQLLYMEFAVLNYYRTRTSNHAGCNFGFFVRPCMSFTDFGVVVNDPVRADVILESVVPEGFAEMNFSIDGKPMASPKGIAHFERTFPKPGIYPLKASISARKMHSDSLCTWEKTFYLKVQE